MTSANKNLHVALSSRSSASRVKDQQQELKDSRVSEGNQIIKHRFISLKKHAERLQGRDKTQFLCQMVESGFGNTTDVFPD